MTHVMWKFFPSFDFNISKKILRLDYSAWLCGGWRTGILPSGSPWNESQDLGDVLFKCMVRLVYGLQGGSSAIFNA